MLSEWGKCDREGEREWARGKKCDVIGMDECKANSSQIVLSRTGGKKPAKASGIKDRNGEQVANTNPECVKITNIALFYQFPFMITYTMKDLPIFTGTPYDHLYVFGIIVCLVGGGILFFVGCDRDVFPTCNGITFFWIGMGITGAGFVMFVAGWLFNGRTP